MQYPKCARLFVAFFFLLFLPGCGLVKSIENSIVGTKTTELTLETTPASIPSGTQMAFTASIDQNNGNFEGATWTLTSNGTSCSPGCGTLSNSTNTGSSGNGDTATITYTAPNTIPIPNSMTITATSVENTSSSGSDTFTITASPLSLQTVALPQGTVGVAYTSTTLQVIGGTGPYTWSLASGNPPSGMSLSTAGGISGTPTAAGVFSFTVQVQDSENPPVTSTTPTPESITIVTVNGTACGAPGGNESLLNGQYAFLLEGSDPNGLDTMVGSFTADGAGNITAGEEDLNLSSGVVDAMQSITPASKAYVVGSDHRGCLALTTGGVTFVYHFALGSISSGIAGKGRLVEFDTSGTVTGGVMKLRDTSAFSTAAISGNYAFVVADQLPGQFVAAGAFNANAGVISSGAVDTNSQGNIDGAGATYPTAPLSFTGSDTVDTNGRGTFSFTTANGQINSTCYVISATELYCTSSDVQGSNPLYPLFAGRILQQSSASFSNSSLNGTSIRYLSGMATSGSGVKVEVGLLQADGSGNFTYTADADDGGSISSPTAEGTYTVASNGRVIVTISGQTLTSLYYLVNSNEAFDISTSPNVTSGFIKPQATGPFSNASLSATYSFGQVVPSAEPFQFQTAELSLDGAGNIAGTADSVNTSSDVLSPGQSLTGQTYEVSSTGRGTLSYNGNVINTFYVISPTEWVAIDSGPANNIPTYPELQHAQE